MMKSALTLLVAILLSGCATTNQFTLAEFETADEAKLPAISVFYKRPADEFRQACAEFDQQSLLHHCRLNRLNLAKFRTEMKAPGIFQDVHYANEEVDYQLIVSTAAYNFEGGDDLGSAVVAGATLMVAPMISSSDIKVDASLYWHGFELKTFQYDIPFEMRSSLMSLNQDTDQDLAKSIASHLLRDLQAEELFTPQYLASQLHSTDYAKTTQFPDQAEGYFRQGAFIYTHPFNGMQVRYLHPEKPEDFIDVFVYPVRNPYWQQDQQQLLTKEVGNVRKDAELVLTEREFTDIHFGQDSRYLWQINHNTLPVHFFEHEYTDLIINTHVSNTYLTIVGDKFVKVRHSALKDFTSQQEIDAFTRNLLSAIQIPGESTFMAKLRKEWRDKSPL